MEGAQIWEAIFSQTLALKRSLGDVVNMQSQKTIMTPSVLNQMRFGTQERMINWF